ncbi:hypothetical protein BHM03_00053802 [Ensete ventricosum]|nr:hypothetical protein BHM03_00053802 [Ensete ventricosum]
MIGAIELQPDDGPRSSLSIKPRFGRCSGISSKFARRFAEGIEKLTGNTPGDHRKKIERLVVRIPEVIGLVGEALERGGQLRQGPLQRGGGCGQGQPVRGRRPQGAAAARGHAVGAATNVEAPPARAAAYKGGRQQRQRLQGRRPWRCRPQGWPPLGRVAAGGQGQLPPA